MAFKFNIFPIATYIIKLINKYYYHKFYRFPDNYTKFSNIAKKFKRKASILYAIGTIDGSHIPIKVPKEFPVDYYNRKGFILLFYKQLLIYMKNLLTFLLDILAQLMIVEYFIILYYIIYLVLFHPLFLQMCTFLVIPVIFAKISYLHHTMIMED